AGTAVGYAEKWVLDGDKGPRAVHWDAWGTAATELENLGTDSGGGTDSQAFALNTAGTTVGFSEKYVSGFYKGTRAVRWDASSTVATELGNLGTEAVSGQAYSRAYAINTAGTAAGFARKYVSGSDKGSRAVRWDA